MIVKILSISFSGYQRWGKCYENMNIGFFVDATSIQVVIFGNWM